MGKIETFNKEYSYIKDQDLVNDSKYLIENLPEYFFHVAASSTGKYHPEYATGDGGLVRHTKAAVRIAYELLNNPLIGNKYSEREKDLLIIALLLHDGLKSGKTESKWHKAEHPLLAVDYIKENKDNLKMTDEDIELIIKVISSHMGIWNKDYDGNEILPIPKSKFENFVHMCDYLASKKFIKIEFDENDNIID